PERSHARASRHRDWATSADAGWAKSVAIWPGHAAMKVICAAVQQRGIALITSLLAIVLLLAIVAVMVNVGTSRLRRANEDRLAAQALAAADAGAAWVRALLATHKGELSDVFIDLAKTPSKTEFSIDSDTTAEVLVGLQFPGPTKPVNHVDINLQENPSINESPLQVLSPTTIRADSHIVATRTVTTLLRSFYNMSPYSEVV